MVEEAARDGGKRRGLPLIGVDGLRCLRTRLRGLAAASGSPFWGVREPHGDDQPPRSAAFHILPRRLWASVTVDGIYDDVYQDRPIDSGLAEDLLGLTAPDELQATDWHP